MLDALKFAQWAVAKKAFVESLVHFQIKDGFIQSYNGMISLCSPIDLDLNCCPKADKFIKAIQTCRETAQLALTPTGKLSIKSGNFRALVDCTNEPFPEVQPEGEELEVQEDILVALKTLEPLISEDSSPNRVWSRGILFSGRAAYATNNVILAEYQLKNWFPRQVNIPHSAVNELIRINKEPVRILVTENSASFIYEDGRWLRTQLYPTTWPDVDRILNPGYEYEGQDVPEGFWTALEDLKAFTNEYSEIHFKPNFITTSLDHETATYVNVEGVPDAGCYNLEMMLLLKGMVDTFEFGGYPRPVRFECERIRGAIIGRRS